MVELALVAATPPAWPAVKQDLSSLITELTASIKTYSYADDSAQATDEQLCAFLIVQLRSAKHRLLPVLDRAHTLAGTQLSALPEANKDAHAAAAGYHDFEHAAHLLRDDLDIFSDEIKLRSFSWTTLEADWLKMLVRKDHELLAGARKLVASVEQLDADLARAADPEQRVLADAGFWPALAAHVGKARAQLSDLVRLFKERENICNVKKFEFSRTLAQIKRAAR